jgi:hypothetical protein
LKGSKKKRASISVFNPENTKESMTMLSFHKSQKAVGVSSGSPTFCQWGGPNASGTCFLTNATPSSKLVLSLFEKTVFLGQVCQ